MVAQSARRRVKKRRSKSQNSKMKIVLIIVIMLMAVLLGYLTTRFVIGPLIGYNSDESPIKSAEDGNASKDSDDSDKTGSQDSKTDNDASKDASEAADDNNKSETVSSVPQSGYALQFGAFSTQNAAEEFARALKEKGIDTKIVEVDRVFKVIGTVFDNKEDILEALDETKEKEISDVFIASF